MISRRNALLAGAAALVATPALAAPVNHDAHMKALWATRKARQIEYFAAQDVVDALQTNVGPEYAAAEAKATRARNAYYGMADTIGETDAAGLDGLAVQVETLAWELAAFKILS